MTRDEHIQNYGVYLPCKKCGKHPNERGDDFCIQNLGKVKNACCGHGNQRGYIQVEDGTLIEGYFNITRGYNVIDNEIGSNYFTCKDCGRVFHIDDKVTYCRFCKNKLVKEHHYFV